MPAGWVSEHIGRWRGRDTEVVYNPRRHQVMTTPGGTDIVDALEAQGWQRHGTDGDRAVWTRDRLDATRAPLTRLDATRAALTRLDHAAVLEPPAPSCGQPSGWSDKKMPATRHADPVRYRYDYTATPDWRPLEQFARICRDRSRLPDLDPDDFMYMGRAVHPTRPPILHYKHIRTRRYLCLDRAGHA